MQIEKRLIKFTIAMMYFAMTAVIDYNISNYLLSGSIDSINYRLYSDLTFIGFTVPAFILGFILFVMLDWGLKKILYEASSFGFWGFVAIAVPLAVPFIWEFFALQYRHNIAIPILTSGVVLFWSILVVGLQYYWLGDETAKRKRAKR